MVSKSLYDAPYQSYQFFLLRLEITDQQEIYTHCF
jgi:hypothetical protein